MKFIDKKEIHFSLTVFLITNKKVKKKITRRINKIIIHLM